MQKRIRERCKHCSGKYEPLAKLCIHENQECGWHPKRNFAMRILAAWADVSSGQGIFRKGINIIYTSNVNANNINTQNLMERSYHTNEFIIKKRGQLDDAVNAALQVLWMFPKLQHDIMSFCVQEEEGPEDLKPVISSIQDFYKIIIYQNSQNDTRILEFDSTNVRLELFKYAYIDNVYSLNKTSDMVDVFLLILNLMHTWQSEISEISCQNSLQPNQRCFVHKNFFIDHEKTTKCSCGIQEQQRMGAYAKPIVIDRFLSDLNEVAAMRIEESKFNINRIKESSRACLMSAEFFTALEKQFTNVTFHCVSKARRDEKQQIACQHQSTNKFNKEHPEIFTMTINWSSQNRKTMNLLRLLLSLQEQFFANILFSTNSAKYWFKGMVCHTNGRYISYFRRNHLKDSFLACKNPIGKERAEYVRELREPIAKETEWVKYKDSSVRFIRNNWTGVLKECITKNQFPTLLFFEKPDDNYGDTVTPSEEFKQYTKDIDKILAYEEQGQKLQIENAKGVFRIYNGELGVCTELDKNGTQLRCDVEQYASKKEASDTYEGYKNQVSGLTKSQSLPKRVRNKTVEVNPSDPLEPIIIIPVKKAKILSIAGFCVASYGDTGIIDRLKRKANDDQTAREQSEKLVQENFYQELKVWKLTYKSKNVYVFPCGSCKQYQMFLHKEKCQYCQVLNEYYDQDLQVDHETWGSAFSELNEIVKKYPQEEEAPRNNENQEERKGGQDSSSDDEEVKENNMLRIIAGTYKLIGKAGNPQRKDFWWCKTCKVVIPKAQNCTVCNKDKNSANPDKSLFNGKLGSNRLTINELKQSNEAIDKEISRLNQEKEEEATDQLQLDQQADVQVQWPDQAFQPKQTELLSYIEVNQSEIGSDVHQSEDPTISEIVGTVVEQRSIIERDLQEEHEYELTERKETMMKKNKWLREEEKAEIQQSNAFDIEADSSSSDRGEQDDYLINISQEEESIDDVSCIQSFIGASGEVTDAQTELATVDESMHTLVKTLLMSDTPPQFIAMATKLNEATVRLMYQQITKEQFAWTPEKNQLLKKYLRQNFTSQDIQKLLLMPASIIEKHTNRIVNSNKKRIFGSRLYRKATNGKHKQYIPPFDIATIAIDHEDQPVKVSDPSQRTYNLYTGNCSCEKPNKHNANFLVIGATGSGKTTLVDSFVNFVLGIEIYDKFRYKLVDEKRIIQQRNETIADEGREVQEGSAQTMSMTSTVTIYHIPATHIVNKISKDNCCINIIDTPGFGDTRGHVWDLKIFNMISNLLNTMQSLNYMLMVVKSTENRLTDSTKFIYKQIQNLYSEDLSERMLGVFTFCDISEPQGYIAVTAGGIKLAEKFKFNNSAMFSSSMDINTQQYFEIGEENFQLFVKYINEKDSLPISLNQTKMLMDKKKQMEKLIVDNKAKSHKATACLLEIAKKIATTQYSAKDFDKATDNCIMKVDMLGQVESLHVNQLMSQYKVNGPLSNSQLLIIGYLDKMLELVKKLHIYHGSYNISSTILAQESTRKDYNMNDFFLEIIDEIYDERGEDWIKSCAHLLEMIYLQTQVIFESQQEGNVDEQKIIDETYARLDGVLTSFKEQIMIGDNSGVKNWIKTRGVDFSDKMLIRMQNKFEDEYEMKKNSIRLGQTMIQFTKESPQFLTLSTSQFEIKQTLAEIEKQISSHGCMLQNQHQSMQQDQIKKSYDQTYQQQNAAQQSKQQVKSGYQEDQPYQQTDLEQQQPTNQQQQLQAANPIQQQQQEQVNTQIQQKNYQTNLQDSSNQSH